MTETKNFHDLTDALGPVAVDRIVRILEAVIAGPIGEAMLEVAEGRSRLVIKQNPVGGGFVIRAESPAEAEAAEQERIQFRLAELARSIAPQTDWRTVMAGGIVAILAGTLGCSALGFAAMLGLAVGLLVAAVPVFALLQWKVA